MSGTADVVETERKYEVEPGFAVPDLADLPMVSGVSEPAEHQLSAVYFDTPGLMLAAASITLRRRTGGTDAGWHLKLPVGVDTRREVRAPLGDGTAAVPAELAGLVSRWSGGEPLRPVAKLDTARTVRRLLGGGGSVLAEIADDRVTGSLPSGEGAGGEPAWRAAVAWREVEAELVSGPAGLLDAVGGRLTAAGAKRSAAAFKLAVVLAAGPTSPQA
jgi:inorganic triphosphatase YgiF